MRLLRYRGVDSPVQITPLNGEALDRWREKVVGHLNSTDRQDRGRYRYEHREATNKTIDPVSGDEYVDRDTAVLERAAPQKPREGRETVDEMVRDTVAQWLMWRRTDPDLFWRKIGELKQTGGLGHLTDEQAADQIVALCTKIEQSEAAITYKTRGIGGGWRGAVILSEVADD